jgi:hypothetical protein
MTKAHFSEIEKRVDQVFETGEGSIQVTFPYDYEVPQDADEAVDAELEFNDRAWSALLEAAELTAEENEKAQPQPLEWKWSGFEEGGLACWINTKEAAMNLAHAGYALEIL